MRFKFLRCGTPVAVGGQACERRAAEHGIVGPFPPAPYTDPDFIGQADMNPLLLADDVAEIVRRAATHYDWATRK